MAISELGQAEAGQVGLVGVVVVDLLGDLPCCGPTAGCCGVAPAALATVVPHDPAPKTVTCMAETYSARQPGAHDGQCGHLDGDGRGVLADVVAAGRLAAGECLVEVLGGEHAEHHRHARVEPDPHDPGGGLPGDVLEVGGLAADHAAEADDGVVVARLGQPLGGERDLERARPPT